MSEGPERSMWWICVIGAMLVLVLYFLGKSDGSDVAVLLLLLVTNLNITNSRTQNQRLLSEMARQERGNLEIVER